MDGFNNMKRIVLSFYSIILILSLILPFLSNTVQASPDIVTQNPQSNSGSSNWLLPTNAYTSNDQDAVCSRTASDRMYYDYDFDTALPEGVTIDKVEIGVEHEETQSPDVLWVRVSWDGGSSWSGYAKIQSFGSETLDWIDATELTDWTRTKLLDVNLRVEVEYHIAEGCYPNNTYLIVYDETGYSIKNPEEISIGETVLVWNEEKGIHHSDVIQVDTHYGNWTFMDFYSGNMTFLTPQGAIVWNKHLTVTSNHPMYDPIQDEDRLANTFQVGDIFAHLNKGELIYLPVDKIDTWNATSNVYNVVVEEKNTCIFVKSFNETELEILSRFPMWRFVGNFDNIAMAIKEPFTTYLDWIPVRVTYSEEEEWVDCQHIGVNNTISGEPTLFSSDWTDINASEGLSHFLFSTNNTGTWTNETWSNSWRDVVWADAIKTLNSTEIICAFRFYINNTEGTVYASTICYFPTTTNGYSWFGVTIIIGLLSCFMLVIVLTAKK